MLWNVLELVLDKGPLSLYSSNCHPLGKKQAVGCLSTEGNGASKQQVFCLGFGLWPSRATRHPRFRNSTCLGQLMARDYAGGTCIAFQPSQQALQQH